MCVRISIKTFNLSGYFFGICLTENKVALLNQGDSVALLPFHPALRFFFVFFLTVEIWSLRHFLSTSSVNRDVEG